MGYAPQNLELRDQKRTIKASKAGSAGFAGSDTTKLAEAMRVPLFNLRSGDPVEVKVPGGFVFDPVTSHRSLADGGLLCSVPMMKTHPLATVTHGMTSPVGVFPGTICLSIRGHMDDAAAKAEPAAASAVVVNIVRADRTVLTGSMASPTCGLPQHLQS